MVSESKWIGLTKYHNIFAWLDVGSNLSDRACHFSDHPYHFFWSLHTSCLLDSDNLVIEVDRQLNDWEHNSEIRKSILNRIICSAQHISGAEEKYKFPRKDQSWTQFPLHLPACNVRKMNPAHQKWHLVAISRWYIFSVFLNFGRHEMKCSLGEKILFVNEYL